MAHEIRYDPQSSGLSFTTVHSLTSVVGPVVRIAPNSLSFNNSRAYADIYGVRANVAKDERYAGLSVSRRTPNLITCTESGLMRFKRKVHAQFLGGQNLEALEGRVLGHVGVFVDVLGSGRSIASRSFALHSVPSDGHIDREVRPLGSWNVRLMPDYDCRRFNGARSVALTRRSGSPEDARGRHQEGKALDDC